MTFDRRTFLQGLGVGALGALTGCNTTPTAARPVTPLPEFGRVSDEAYWRAVRSQFPLLDNPAYLNTGGLGPAAQSVLDTVYSTMSKLQEHSETGYELFHPARESMARYLGVQPSEVCFTRNATEGNSIIAAGLTLRPGDEVIFESHAHPGGSHPWLQQARLRGVVVKTFVPDAQDAAGNLARIAALCNARTRVVQVSHVTAPTGIVMPVADLARFCRGRGIWFHMDGAQSAGMFPFSLREIGGDSYATSGHKWLGGPHETGVLVVRRERMDEVAPVLVGAYSGEIDAPTGELHLAADAMRYEYGTRNAAAVLGLAEAVRFQEEIGRERIAARGRMLAARVRAGLERLPGIEILTPKAPDLSAAMTTFRSARVPHDQLFNRLMKDYAIRCRPVTEEKLNAIRVSTHFFNSPAECDALIAGVEKILRTA